MKKIKRIFNKLFFKKTINSLLDDLVLEKNNISLQFCEKCRVNAYYDSNLLTRYNIVINQIKRLEKLINK